MKIVGGIVFLLAVSVIYLGVSHLSQDRKTISEWIEESGKTTLMKGSGSDKHWKVAGQAYKDFHKGKKKSQDTGALYFFNGNSIPNEDAPEGFMDKCESLYLLEIPEAKGDVYDQVLRGCTKQQRDL